MSKTTLKPFFMTTMVLAISLFPIEAREKIGPFLKSIIDSPELKAKVIEKRQEGNLFIEKVSFFSRKFEKKEIRVHGILAYPKSKTPLPAILWSQSGMSPAEEKQPLIFAKKGYFCLNITLPHAHGAKTIAFSNHKRQRSFLAQCLKDHMRAITYLTHRPEVNKEMIGVAGSSYGGFFSTLLAGMDLRVKAGMSFFAGAELIHGTNLPGFHKMQSSRDIDTWMRTLEASPYLRRRKIPFIWGIAAQDRWFYLPSLIETYRKKADIANSRILIAPNHDHGLPPEMDASLYNWFDSTLVKTKPAYPRVTKLDLNVDKEKGELSVSCFTEGAKKLKRVELVLSPGSYQAWGAFNYRHHEVFKMKIDGPKASVKLKIPDVELPHLIYATLYDDAGPIVSNMPNLILPKSLGLTSQGKTWNLSPLAGFENAQSQASRLTLKNGIRLSNNKALEGDHCLEIDANIEIAKFKLCFVPNQNHHLSLSIRSDKAETLKLKVVNINTLHSQGRMAKFLWGVRHRGIKYWNTGHHKVIMEKSVNPTKDWSKFELVVPSLKGEYVGGHQLWIERSDKKTSSKVYLDDLRYTWQPTPPLAKK